MTELVPMGHQIVVIGEDGQRPHELVTVDDSHTFDGGQYIKVVSSDAPTYRGPYEVTPRATEQVLATKTTLMTDDVTVNGIPYYETSNASGGYTVTIG